jgi:hypothetical protein
VRRSLALTAALLAVCAADAHAAGEPTMPLKDVRSGMRCTVRSVVHGTTISTFDATVLDVVDGDPAGEDARVLVRLSGPAIADGGIGPGFSGSPVTCPDAGGRPRVMGALSEGIGDYGNDVALATPIEEMLGQPVRPVEGNRARRRLGARTRPLAALTIAGLPRSLRGFVERAARRAGRTVIVTPGGPPTARYAPPPLVPGASVAAGISTGSLALASVGTVTYRDGNDLWAFGHSLDDAGLRSLFLQDAYVYGVIGNPVGSADAQTYKLAAPGHVRGALTGDGPNAVAGTLGAGPRAVTVVQQVRDRDTGRTVSLRTLVADEVDLGDPDGTSPLTLIAGLGTASVGTSAFRGGPADQSGRVCARITLRETKRPLRFCDRYAARGLGGADAPGAVPLAAADDITNAIGLVEGASFARLHVNGIRVELAVERGLRLLRLVSARVPVAAHAGRRIRVRVRLRRSSGAVVTRTVALRVPKGLGPGRRRLVLAGAAPSAVPNYDDQLADELGGGGTPAVLPGSLPQLVRAVAGLQRFDGLRARFATRPATRAYRDPDELITGRLLLRLRVVR